MTAYVLYRSFELPWMLSEQEQRRFRKILKRVLAICLVLAVIVPMLPVPKVEREEVDQLPPRLAKFVLEQQERRRLPPSIVPKQAPLKTAKRAPRLDKPRVTKKRQPRAAPQTIEGARRKAERAGLLAFKDELAALRDDATLKQIKARTPLTRGAATKMASAERALVTAGAARGSSGISTAKFSRDTGGGALAGRQTVSVDSPVANVGSTDGAQQRLGNARKASRSIEEIQLVFDRNKAAIYSIYNRALRANPALEGKVVLRITITPSGKVAACDLVSSELGAPGLEGKIIARVRLFDFGAKDVETVVVTYPIDFLPS